MTSSSTSFAPCRAVPLPAPTGRRHPGRSRAPCGTAAGRRDLLKAVQLLVARGAGGRGWDTATALQLAARRGHQALAQYLLQQTPGHRLGGPVLLAAAQAGCEALMEWMVGQQGCNTCRSPYLHPARYGDLGTLAALRRLGVPWRAEGVVLKAVEAHCGVDALRWLVEQGAPVGSAAEVDQAVVWEVHEGHLDPQTAAWLQNLAAGGQGSGAAAAPEPGGAAGAGMGQESDGTGSSRSSSSSSHGLSRVGDQRVG